MPKKILIVDDSPLLHRMYEYALKAYPGCAVELHGATNGRDALARLHEHPDTALVLLDVNMPEMSGLEFLRHMRAEAAFKDIAVVLQSTEDQVEDIHRGLAAGARGYLTKPFSHHQLYQLLDAVLA